MEIHEMVSHIKSREDFADFVEKLRQDLLMNPEGWENHTLERFLDAMSMWVSSMDSLYKNLGRELPLQPEWKTFAEILSAAVIYE